VTNGTGSPINPIAVFWPFWHPIPVSYAPAASAGR